MRKKKVLIIIVAIVLLFVLLAFGAYKYMNSRTSQLFGSLVSRVDTDEKVVALTFDDGPTDKTTEILQNLDELGIKCTFFLTGREMEENMSYAQAIADAGHQIGSHSYSHNHMVLKSMVFIENELDTTNDIIRQAGFTGDIVFRPPYGKKLIFLPIALKKRDMVTIMWDIEPDSYKEVASSSENIADYVIDNVQNGSIILLHIMYDGGQNARDALPEIVSRLEDMGYSFVTVNELLALQ